MDVIGRGPQLDEVARRVTDRRLVTIMGPGGIGRTALATAVSEAMTGRFTLGHRFVDLTERAPPSGRDRR